MSLKANASHLLKATNSLIAHQKEKERLKGERFNIFSILKMERNEEHTHSAFIAELLKPKGSHLMGDVFLRLFLKHLQQYNPNLEVFDPKLKGSVIVEKYIGKVNLDNKEGGKIDIYIQYNNNQFICIENKIDAKDQAAQLVRYSKVNKGNNTLIYLTKKRSLPSRGSILKKNGELLKDKEDFHCLSYKEDIITWLEACLKEATDQAILRESIKQYLVLIKKITNTMDEEEKAALNKLITQNVEASRYIAQNFGDVIRQVRRNFRDAIIVELKRLLKAKFKHDFEIALGGDIKTTNAPIWIKKNKTDKIYFGVEPFSGSPDSYSHGNLFIGICDDRKIRNFENYDNSYGKVNDFWQFIQELKIGEETINLHQAELLNNLSDPKSTFFKNIIKEVSLDCLSFIEEHLSFVEKMN